MDMDDTTPAPQVWPTLRAHDARALIRFLIDAFGFEETVVHGEGDRVDHAQLSWPEGGGIMLGSAKQDGADDAWPLRPWGTTSFGGITRTRITWISRGSTARTMPTSTVPGGVPRTPRRPVADTDAGHAPRASRPQEQPNSRGELTHPDGIRGCGNR